MLSWANQFSVCCFLDNNGYQHSYHSHECLLAVNAVTLFSPSTSDQLLPELKAFMQQQKDWLFGHFSYHCTLPGYKNAAQHLTNQVNFPDAFLFQPETVIELKGNQAVISTHLSDPEALFQHILQTAVSTETASPGIAIEARFTREEYLHTLHQLLGHIQRGDCYEINFCQEFYAQNASITPLALYNRLNQLSPTPYAAFYKLHDKYALCASPERYIKKEGNTLISQPIKGTAKRVHGDSERDQAARTELLGSQKEKSENVMVVDLVRNDLSRICIPGSVYVEELFGIYTFPQVHQMISTIKGTLQPGKNLADVLEASFPMGSMTGAPKPKVIELVNQYERTQRGLYSGSIGYITPAGDFDFNVVIRSILYNATDKYLSYQVGGGITFYSNAEKEYEECLIKAAAIKKVLE